MTATDILHEDAASGNCDAIRRTTAHPRMEGGDHIGKIVLTLGG